MSSPAHPRVETPTLTPDALDIALVSPGDRTDRLTAPLDAIDGTWTVNPSDPTAHDVVVCDTPDREMLRAVARCRVDGTPVLFRQRGDPFWGIDEWLDSRVKKAVLYRMLRAVDGCLAIAPHQASKFARKTGVPTDLVTLPKAVDGWPDTIHTDTELRLLTLTNCVYPDKIEPLAEIAPAIDDILAESDGTWRIGSWSEGHDDWLREQLAPFEHIEFELRLDAEAELEWANMMVHYSRLDVLPNAILEGMASRLPVLTNDHVAFRQSRAPLTVTRTQDGLRDALERYQDPARRREAGELGHQYVASQHDPADVGEDLLAAIRRLVGGDVR
jgi:glycosyltransferase involved in cell wall biosynthesis